MLYILSVEAKRIVDTIRLVCGSSTTQCKALKCYDCDLSTFPA